MINKIVFLLLFSLNINIVFASSGAVLSDRTNGFSGASISSPKAVLPQSLLGKRSRENSENTNTNTRTNKENRNKSEGFAYHHPFKQPVVDILMRHGINSHFLWLSNYYMSHPWEKRKIQKDINKLPSQFKKSFRLIKETIQVIQNHKFVSESIIYKDLLNKIHSSFGKGSFRDLVNSLRIHGIQVIDITPEMLTVEAREETAQEKLHRKARTKEILREVLEQHVNPAKIKSIESFESQTWRPYLNFFDKRKQDIEKSSAARITRKEIEDVFLKTVAKHYKEMPISGGSRFFYAPDTVVLDLKRDDLTNLERLKAGLAPIGVDGETMNVHHLTHQQPGFYVLLSQKFHQKNNGSLHFKSKNHFTVNKNIDRPAFEIIKKNIFLKLVSHLGAG